MTTETCGAHCSKAERSENVSEQSKGDLKREPKISKIAAEIVPSAHNNSLFPITASYASYAAI